MERLKGLGGIVKSTFYTTDMREAGHHDGSADVHEPERHVTNIKPATDVTKRTGNNAPCGSIVKPSSNKRTETNGRKELNRLSRKTSQAILGGADASARVMKDAIRDVEVKLKARKRDVQAQRSEMKQLEHAFCMTQAENDQLKQERKQLLEGNQHQKFYCDRYKYIVEQFLLPYAKEKNVQFDDRTGETLDSLLIPLVQNAQESVILHNQVQVLQQELLSREKRASPISDENFEKDFRKLATQIKTLSLLLRPREGVDIVEALGPCTLASESTQSQWSDRTGKRLFIEAWIWSNLIYLVFRTPFSVFGTQSDIMFNLWSTMFGTQHCHGWPRPSLACETWRYTTNEQLETIFHTTVVMEGKPKDQYSSSEQHAMTTRNVAIEIIEASLALIAPTSHSLHVCQIVNNAFTLAMQMSLQRSRLQITFPNTGDSFSVTQMTPLPAYSEENTEKGIVASVINPGLTKWGDANGKSFHHRYDIVPALVCLQDSVVENSARV